MQRRVRVVERRTDPSVCHATLVLPPTPIVTIALALLAALVAVVLMCALGVSQAAAAPQNARAAAVSAEISDLDVRLDAAVARYGVTSRQLVELRASLRANASDLRRTEYSLLLAKAELRRRVVAMYKERPVDLLDVVMGSADFDELLGKLAVVRRLGAADAELVSSTERLERELLRARRALAESAARVRTGLAEIARERDGLETMLVQRRHLVVELSKVVRDRSAGVPRPKPTPSPTSTISGQGAWWSAVQAASAANGITARGLYKLMLAESGGVATARNGPYCGLFQYSRGTWHGPWNPWRGADIFDGAAQIKASARAIKLGYGPVFWPNTYGYAFAD